MRNASGWLATSRFLIGPAGARWDVVQPVYYHSRQAVIALGSSDLKTDVLLRAVRLADARVMPMLQQPLAAVNHVR